MCLSVPSLSSHFHTCPHPRSDDQKLDLYELVYFVRPQKAGTRNDAEAVLKRFKDKSRCMKIFRAHNKVRRRCLLTRSIYGEAEVNDLGVTTTDVWRVRSCRPKFRRDQIVRGLANLSGVTSKLSLQLAKRIPRTEYPASIESVKKYCLKNFCRDCKGGRLYGDVQVTRLSP